MGRFGRLTASTAFWRLLRTKNDTKDAARDSDACAETYRNQFFQATDTGAAIAIGFGWRGGG
jgi:hypothetical protein